MKKKILAVPGVVADKALNRTMKFAIPKLEAFKDEDPKKVVAFLTDLSTEPTLPQEVRDAGKRLLDAYQKNTAPLHEVIHAKITEDVQNLESQLEVSMKEKDKIH